MPVCDKSQQGMSSPAKQTLRGEVAVAVVAAVDVGVEVRETDTAASRRPSEEW